MGDLPRISVRRTVAAVVVLAVVSYHFAGGLNTYVVTLSYGNRASAGVDPAGVRCRGAWHGRHYHLGLRDPAPHARAVGLLTTPVIKGAVGR